MLSPLPQHTSLNPRQRTTPAAVVLDLSRRVFFFFALNRLRCVRNGPASHYTLLCLWLPPIRQRFSFSFRPSSLETKDEFSPPNLCIQSRGLIFDELIPSTSPSLFRPSASPWYEEKKNLIPPRPPTVRYLPFPDSLNTDAARVLAAPNLTMPQWLQRQ